MCYGTLHFGCLLSLPPTLNSSTVDDDVTLPVVVGDINMLPVERALLV